MSYLSVDDYLNSDDYEDGFEEPIYEDDDSEDVDPVEKMINQLDEELQDHLNTNYDEEPI